MAISNKHNSIPYHNSAEWLSMHKGEHAKWNTNFFEIE
jgi:hypothetical protein